MASMLKRLKIQTMLSKLLGYQASVDTLWLDLPDNYYLVLNFEELYSLQIDR